MRLGFAVKVLGKEGIKSSDARRWQNSPHLKFSIEYAHIVFDYLEATGITMYRLPSDFAPYLTHPDLPQFHNQLEEAHDELVELGKHAQKLNLRLSFHPSQYILLNSPNEKLTEGSIREFVAASTMLDIMGCGSEAVVVTHVGGVYGDRDGSIARFIKHYNERLPEVAKKRLVLENDDKSYGVADTLRIHKSTGVRLIFDHQHHSCINNGEMTHEEACCASLKTWGTNGRPKIHFSSPRIENRTIMRRDKETGKRKASECAPLMSQHADMVDSDVFVPFARSVRELCGIEFDVMCEAKSKDLAVLQLREDLQKAGDFVVE
ncbi:UV DNA damage endonuclease [Abditibacteriota bacterium]|nr:UV DNA damage endonuclease [Abditibacteriota bacterium]